MNRTRSLAVLVAVVLWSFSARALAQDAGVAEPAPPDVAAPDAGGGAVTQPPPDAPPVPPAPEPPVPPAPATTPGPVATTSPVIAGWHNDLFFIADASHDWFIIPTGRLQVDGFFYVGDRVTEGYPTGSGLHRGDVKDTLLLRRARIELVGGLFQRFTYMVAADFASGNAPIATDNLVNARALPELNFQLGQFDAPFTLENRTSDKYIDFMERSLAVRALGIPTNKEIGVMAWGEDANRYLYYSAGLFAGDGQNRTNRDNNFDFMARVFAHPLIGLGGALSQLQIGASFRYGVRGRDVDYAYSSMSTQAQWAFFGPGLVGGTSPITLVPDSGQLGVAAELDLPIDAFDVRSEFVYVSNGTREMAAAPTDAAHLAGDAVRLGDLTGFGWYLQVGWWAWGSTGVSGKPGYQNPPNLRLDHEDPATPPTGLQLVARFDMLDVRYSGGSRGSVGMGGMSADGRYTVYAIQVGANLWLTKHVRISLDYSQYVFPSQPEAGMTRSDDNHAHGPHFNGSTFGEITARLGLAL